MPRGWRELPAPRAAVAQWPAVHRDSGLRKAGVLGAALSADPTPNPNSSAMESRSLEGKAPAAALGLQRMQLQHNGQ